MRLSTATCVAWELDLLKPLEATLALSSVVSVPSALSASAFFRLRHYEMSNLKLRLLCLIWPDNNATRPIIEVEIEDPDRRVHFSATQSNPNIINDFMNLMHPNSSYGNVQFHSKFWRNA